MNHLTGYGAYKLFLALRNHFKSDSYDFFKYGGKTNGTRDTYEKRRDKSFFEKYAKVYDAEELRDFYVANLIENNVFITDMKEELYQDYKTRKESLTYKFKEDLDEIYIYENGLLKTLNWKKGECPLILELYLQKRISLESLIILDSLFPGYGFRKSFDDNLGNSDLIWPMIRKNMDKLKPFIKFDKEKVKQILKEKIHEIGRECKGKAPEEVATKKEAYSQTI